MLSDAINRVAIPYRKESVTQRIAVLPSGKNCTARKHLPTLYSSFIFPKMNLRISFIFFPFIL